MSNEPHIGAQVHQTVEFLLSEPTQFDNGIQEMSAPLQKQMKHWRIIFHNGDQKKIDMTLLEIEDWILLSARCSLVGYNYQEVAPTFELRLKYRRRLQEEQEKLATALSDAAQGKGNTYQLGNTIYQNYNQVKGQVYVLNKIDVYTDKQSCMLALCRMAKLSPMLTKGVLSGYGRYKFQNGFPLTLEKQKKILTKPKTTSEDMIGAVCVVHFNIAQMSYPEAHAKGLLGEGDEASKRKLHEEAVARVAAQMKGLSHHVDLLKIGKMTYPEAFSKGLLGEGDEASKRKVHEEAVARVATKKKHDLSRAKGGDKYESNIRKPVKGGASAKGGNDSKRKHKMIVRGVSCVKGITLHKVWLSLPNAEEQDAFRNGTFYYGWPQGTNMYRKKPKVYPALRVSFEINDLFQIVFKNETFSQFVKFNSRVCAELKGHGMRPLDLIKNVNNVVGWSPLNYVWIDGKNVGSMLWKEPEHSLKATRRRKRARKQQQKEKVQNDSTSSTSTSSSSSSSTSSEQNRQSSTSSSSSSSTSSNQNNQPAVKRKATTSNSLRSEKKKKLVVKKKKATKKKVGGTKKSVFTISDDDSDVDSDFEHVPEQRTTSRNEATVGKSSSEKEEERNQRTARQKEIRKSIMSSDSEENGQDDAMDENNITFTNL